MDNKPDYDAMFTSSQNNPFAKPEEQRNQYDEMYRNSMQKSAKPKTPDNPEVLDQGAQPYLNMKKPAASPETLGLISLIIGIAAFVLIFVGMFLRAFLWLNVLLCLVGIGFGIAALMKNTLNRVFGIIGIILGIFDLLVNVICMIVLAIGSGISAIFHLFT